MKKVSILIVLCLVLFSCNKEEVAIEKGLTHEITVSKNLVYKNQVYLVQIDENGQVDKSNLTENLIKAISSSHIVEWSEENTIYLFDQADEMNTFIATKTVSPSSKVNKMAGAKAGVARSKGYQHENYRGFPLGGTGNFGYPSLQVHGFNDLIDSIIITNLSARAYLAQYFEHDNYQGRVYTTILSPGEVKYRPDMRFFGFHDKTSSMLGRYL